MILLSKDFSKRFLPVVFFIVSQVSPKLRLSPLCSVPFFELLCMLIGLGNIGPAWGGLYLDNSFASFV